MRGHGRGTYGWGARKKHISSGNRGGYGMAGLEGHKKGTATKLFGDKYFGKQGFTSRATEHKINNVINIGDIERDIERLKKKYGNKEGILVMEDFKILGDGEIKIKVTIEAESASKSAIAKIEKAGGKVILPIIPEKKAFVANPMVGGKKSHKTVGEAKKE